MKKYLQLPKNYQPKNYWVLFSRIDFENLVAKFIAKELKLLFSCKRQNYKYTADELAFLTNCNYESYNHVSEQIKLIFEGENYGL